MEGTDFTHIFTRYLPHSYFNKSLPFPYSAMWFGHDCQTTWQNMEMDSEQFRNLQESGRCNIYIRLRYKKLSTYRVYCYSEVLCFSIFFFFRRKQREIKVPKNKWVNILWCRFLVPVLLFYSRFCSFESRSRL